MFRFCVIIRVCICVSVHKKICCDNGLDRFHIARLDFLFPFFFLLNLIGNFFFFFFGRNELSSIET